MNMTRYSANTADVPRIRLSETTSARTGGKMNASAPNETPLLHPKVLPRNAPCRPLVAFARPTTALFSSLPVRLRL